MKILHKARNLSIGMALFLGFSMPLQAQVTQEYLQQFIEFITENQEGSEEFDYSEIGEQLDDWSRSPIDINSPDAAILVQWKIISDNAYRNLQEHILRNGPLLDLLELQSIDGFDTETIHILDVIARVEGRILLTQAVPLGEMLIHGQNEIYVRGGRTIQKADGYLGESPAYEGSPDKLYMRYRHRNSNTLTYGITAEKDAGEAFFNGSNPQGFDFYSYHLALQHYKPWLPALMIGDFNANFGQGLIMHSGFGVSKSSFVTSIKRSGNPLRPYTSVEENNFLRGVGISLKPVDNLTITLLCSQHRRDGNLIIDTVYEDGQIENINEDITSLQTSNLHRTKAEIADEDAINLTQGGLSIAYTNRRAHLALNALHSRLSTPLNRSPDLYNQYYFNGDNLTNASIDYGLWFGGLHFFGETAVSDNGGLATLNGLLAGLDRHVTAAILFRSYARDYQALTPNAFGEGSLANNETGLYTGLEITPSSRWKIQLYQDIWSHPWLRYNIDSPTEGNEYFGRVTYTVKRRLEIYGQYRSKRTGINSRPTGEAIAEVVDQYRSQARLHINNMLTKGIQLRTRLEWTFYTTPLEDQKGFMIYQDFVYSPIASPWTFSARVTLFDTDDYDSRVYTYENDLIYYYAIPAFSNQGSRYYINVRYKGIRNLTAEIKFAQTRELDATSLSSGNDEIQGNLRSEIRAQLIYRFDN
jgi:hypothetical protein